MRRELSFRRCLYANAIFHRLRDPRILRFVPPKIAMADDAKVANVTAAPREEESGKTGGASPEKLPPPPEKPLPGDCCGSGCVRCVWDVYYEELEEYNNLLREKENPMKS